MRRTLSPSVALLAGLVVLLSGCAGETTGPDPRPTPTPGPGACTVNVALAASSFSSFAGTPVVIRATVTKGGAAVPEGQSVTFTTDFGVFAETGNATVTKLIMSGVADVTLFSANPGKANVTAHFECGSARTAITFSTQPGATPYISSIVPNEGSCRGGETVVINGGNFGSTVGTTRVTFGGAPATVTTVTTNRIEVLTPLRNLANNEVPETVDVVVTVNANTASAASSDPRPFRYFCVDPNQRLYISSLSPTSGPQEGGTVVTILGGNFGSDVTTTRVTFGGVAAQITTLTSNQITVTTPRHPLANPSVPETVDVAVTRDLGLPSQQGAVLTRAFTYRGQPSTDCPSRASVFVSSITPQRGTTNGGTVVTIRGGGFGTSAANTRVEFRPHGASGGGIAGQVTAVTDTAITASTPRWTLASPEVPETVDVIVTVDVGGPNCATARLDSSFTFETTNLPIQIFSISPTTGPNDVSTRVTISGQGFRFPMQVFMTAGACGGALVEAVVVNPISSTEIVFQTPIAENGNVCLANQLASVRVRDWYTGDQDTLADAFKFYACPTVTAIDPGFGPYSGGTTVVINGHNFAEPVQVKGANTPWRVVSVSESQIIAVTQPVVVTSCTDITGPVTVNSPVLTCGAVAGPPYTYQVSSIRPIITSVVPPVLPEAGGLVTVYGRNFFDDLRIVIHMSSGDIRVTPTVISTTQLTFVAPPFTGTWATVDCDAGGGLAGTRKVNTPVTFDVRNIITSCIASDVIVYAPDDTSCVVAAGP